MEIGIFIMAAGDVVSGIGTSGGTLDFQPASGVECIITWMTDNTDGHALFNGTTASTTAQSMNTSSLIQPNFKIFINNTRYLRINPTVGGVKSYTGMQTK